MGGCLRSIASLARVLGMAGRWASSMCRAQMGVGGGRCRVGFESSLTACRLARVGLVGKSVTLVGKSVTLVGKSGTTWS